MKPQKRSIKDFFSPVSQRPRESPNPTPQLPDATSARASPLGAASASRDSASLTINTPTVPATSSTPHAATATKATSPDALPPEASQNSANSGASKRIVSNGEQIVLNSDSDDDSLPDLDWGAAIKTTKEPTRAVRSTRITAYDDDDDDELRRPGPKPRSKKRTFDHVFESALKNKEVEQLVETHKASLAQEEEETTRFVFDEKALGHVIQNEDDPEQTHRLFLAMQRTGAVQEENVFHFFQDTSDSVAVQSRFPASCLPRGHWTSSFRDAFTRDQAFLNGFAHQVFRLQQLPQELASWMIDQICLGESDTLDSKYLDILELHDEHLRALLDRNRLDAIFRALGADVKGFKSDAPLVPSFDPHSARSPALPPSLKSAAILLRRAAPWLNTKARGHAFYLLCHVCMDDRVVADSSVLDSVQDAMEDVLCNFADNHKLVQGVGSSDIKDEVQTLIASQLSDVLPRMFSRVTHPVMQRDLVSTLPSGSPMTAYLQRHIALAFILHPTPLDIPLADPRLPKILHNHLETSPNFRINKKTDYRSLAARMTLLDIAIGPGLLTVPYQPLTSPAQSEGEASPVMAPVPASSELKDFNKEIDALAQHIKMLGNSIVEAGAVVDLSILEAKDSVERLCARLEHAVRIGGKKSHNVFGDDDEDRQLKVTDIFRKVAANARKNASDGVGTIFDDDDEADVDDAVEAQLTSEVAR